MLFAFEQTDYCDFEVQFEMTHNLIHAWVGGDSQFGLSSLDYTAYDPLFYIHHSGVDRLWAVWQALQAHRGYPYNEAYCSIEKMKLPIRPFSDESNPNDFVRKHATPNDVFDYTHLGYKFDDLSFNGMNILQLDQEIQRQQENDRIFAGFMLKGFKKSAVVSFDICRTTDDVCEPAGKFAILGSLYEMPWSYDKQFQYDITGPMNTLGLRYDDGCYSKVYVSDIQGNPIADHEVSDTEINFRPGTGKHLLLHYFSTVDKCTHCKT
jgi:hypothetical protein